MTAAWQVLATVLVAQASPVSTIRDLTQALSSCFRAPEGTAGSQLTVRFSLTREGAIQGKPAVTFSKLLGSPADQRAFVAAVLGGLAACTPVPLSPGLGNAIAGRPLSLRFRAGGRETAV